MNERGTSARALSPARIFESGYLSSDPYQRRASEARRGGGDGGEGGRVMHPPGSSGGRWEGREIVTSKSLSFKKLMHLPSQALEEAAMAVSSPKKLSLSPHRPRLADMRRMLLLPEAGGLEEPHQQSHELPRHLPRQLQQQLSPQRLRQGDGKQEGLGGMEAAGGGGGVGGGGGLVYPQQQRQQASPQRIRPVSSQQQRQVQQQQQQQQMQGQQQQQLSPQQHRQQQARSPQRTRPAGVLQHQLSPQRVTLGGGNATQQQQLQKLPGELLEQKRQLVLPLWVRQAGMQQQQQQQRQQQQEKEVQEPTTPGRSLVHNMGALPRGSDRSPTRKATALVSAGAAATASGDTLPLSSPRLKLAEVKRRFLVHDVPVLSQDEAAASLPSDLVTAMLIHQHLDDDDDDDDDDAMAGGPRDAVSPPHLTSPRLPWMHVQPLGFSGAVDVPLINPPETRKLLHDMRSLNREEASALF